MWKIKNEKYQQNPDEKLLKILETLGRNRYDSAKEFLDYASGMSHPDCSLVRYDLVKCSIEVFKDMEKAKAYAESLAASLHHCPESFTKAFGIPWYPNISEKKLAQNILEVARK